MYIRSIAHCLIFGKKKSVNPITGLDKPWGFQQVEAPIFLGSRHKKMLRLSALHTGHLYSPGNIPGNNLCYRLSQPQGHRAAGRIMSTENSSDTIGNRTHSVPQPTAPSRAPYVSTLLLLLVTTVVAVVVVIVFVAVTHFSSRKLLQLQALLSVLLLLPFSPLNINMTHVIIKTLRMILTFWRRISLFQILAHPVFKTWVIQKPNKVALWNKRHFEEKNWILYSMFKIFSTDTCWINI